MTLDQVFQNEVPYERPSTTQIILAGFYVVTCLSLMAAVLGVLFLL